MLRLDDVVGKAKEAIKESKKIEELESIRVEYLGKQGYFSFEVKKLRKLAPKERPEKGAAINQAKQEVQAAFLERKKIMESERLTSRLSEEYLDITLPGRRTTENGGLHPVTRTISRIEHFFRNVGFSVVTGPEIEDDYHNFNALNIPENHPARTYDTFWFDSNRLLRTQTSCVQIRTMQEKAPPIRIIASGRVYRHDYDQVHTPMFHQMEGLLIDTHVSFTHLKGILHDFLRNFFEEDLKIRFRPSYFPFTEPSAEVDVMTNNGHWLEILGCGMVHPNVLRNVGIELEKYSGFAFGMGMERLTMLRYGVTDSRTFFENDLRFLKQFK